MLSAIAINGFLESNLDIPKKVIHVDVGTVKIIHVVC